MKPQVNLKRWSAHLDAAKRQGKSVAAYAAEHGLSRHTLYAAARALRDASKPYTQKQTPTRGVKAEASAFSAVRISAPLPTVGPEPAPRLMVQWPNGILLHIDGLSAPVQISALLNTLGALRCSR